MAILTKDSWDKAGHHAWSLWIYVSSKQTQNGTCTAYCVLLGRLVSDSIYHYLISGVFMVLFSLAVHLNRLKWVHKHHSVYRYKVSEFNLFDIHGFKTIYGCNTSATTRYEYFNTYVVTVVLIFSFFVYICLTLLQLHHFFLISDQTEVFFLTFMKSRRKVSTIS